MSDSTPVHGNLFTRAFAAAAVLSPILLVIIAGTLPEGTSERGYLMVNGLMFVAAALAIALLLRSVYAIGFRHGRKLFGSQRKHSVAA